MSVSYKESGSVRPTTPYWHAERFWLMYGPQLVKPCLTTWGARFAAWRRNRRDA